MAMCVPMGIQDDVAADGFCKCIFCAAFCLCIPAKKCITFSYRVGGNYKRLVIRVAFCGYQLIFAVNSLLVHSVTTIYSATVQIKVDITQILNFAG